MLAASLVQINNPVCALEFRRGGRNHCLGNVRVFFFTRLDEITPSPLTELVCKMSIVVPVRSQCVVHGSQVHARLALLHQGLLVLALLRIELDLVLSWPHLTLQLLWLLGHRLQVPLRELLV